MCRLAAYLGPPLSLQQFVLDPPHSLVVQAYAPAEMQTAVLNADGFGVGWYNRDEHPAAYRSMAPAWADPNLPELGRSLVRDSWFANVRSATDPFSGGYSNTQPFITGHLLFLHNGFIADFADGPRSAIRRWLKEDFERPIAGNTDSEYLFAVWRQLLAAHDGDWAEATRHVLDLLASWTGNRRALLNVIVSDGREMAVLRHAFNCDPPSLYMSLADPTFPGGSMVASEPLTDRNHWQPVPTGALHILSRDGQCTSHRL